MNMNSQVARRRAHHEEGRWHKTRYSTWTFVAKSKHVGVVGITGGTNFLN